MKTIKVTDMYEMSKVFGTNLNIYNEQTNLDDIDDDFGDTPLDFNNAVTPELPHRDFNIATLTPEKLEQLRKGSN
jgi:hypothetical protein